MRLQISLGFVVPAIILVTQACVDPCHTVYVLTLLSLLSLCHFLHGHMLVMMNSISRYPVGVVKGTFDGADLSHLSAKKLDSIASAVQTALSIQ